MLEVGAEGPPPFLWLLPAACQGVLTLWAETLHLVKQAFPVGTAAPGQHWPSFLNCLCVFPWAVPPSLLSSWLEPFMSPKLLAYVHRSTVTKNTLSRGLLFGPSLPYPPLPLLTTYK